MPSIAPVPSNPNMRCITSGQAAALEQSLLDLEMRLAEEPWWKAHIAELRTWIVSREVPAGIAVNPLF